MEKIVRKHANKIATSLGYDEEKEAVVAYGLLAMVQVAVTTIAALVLGFLIGAPVETMIVCFSVSIFRKYSGGAHAHDADFCTVFSIIYCTIAAAISRWIVIFYHPIILLIAIVLCYSIAYRVIFRYVPVDSPNKPITNENKIKKMRRGSYIIVSAYFIFQMIFLIFAGRYQYFRSYGISLLLGTAWQTLTLTPLGAILLDKLNDLPKYLRKEIKK